MNSSAVPMRTLIILGIAGLLFLGGCGGSTSHSFDQPPNPTPTITTISPNSAMAGAPFTLTINGTNFVAASMVNFGGTAPATTFVSATQVTAVIPAPAIASAGTATVTVTNPVPGGGTSNAVNFTITGRTNPVPTIITLNPSGATVGGAGFTLGVDGFNSLASSVVQWNGSDRPTTFDSTSGVLTAQISASDIAATGTATVTVLNPAPGGGTSNTLTFTIATGAVYPNSVAVDPTGKFAYVANSGTNNVSMYTINGTTGALTLIGRIDAGIGPASVAVDPSGKFIYVANESNFDSLVGNVSMYTIDSTSGALTSMGSPVAADFGAHSVSVDPLGKFAYVANDGIYQETGGSLSTYTINSTTGALTPTGTVYAVCPGTGCSLLAPLSVTLDPSGMFLYVANEGGFAPTNVSMYTINATTGALTSIGAVAAGGRAVSVAVDPKGNFAYMTNISNGFPGENNIVSMFTINATTGALTSIGTIAAGTYPVSVVVDPTGKFAYVANSSSKDVSMYTISATTGALTPIGTIAAGSSPTSIAIHPSGKFAYVTNSGSNIVSMYSIDAATGALTLIGTIGT